MLLIYTPKNTHRLSYTFEHIFEHMLGVEASIINQKQAFADYKGPKLNYSSRQHGEEMFFYASPLLFENGIKPQRIKVQDYADTKIFFISKNNSDLPFDLFAATFYLITRYEEYLDKERDEHGRFPAHKSMAVEHDFLHQAVVDRWCLMLLEVLLQYYPDLKYKRRKFRYRPSYDIDLAWAFKNKGVLRNLGGLAYNLRHREMANVRQRLSVLLGGNPDPYDTFAFQRELQKTHRLDPIYFFLVGDYGEFDKNISIENLSFQELIRSTGDHAEVGVHPSYDSNENGEALELETKRLQRILKKDIVQSRQHFLRLDLPDTYQQLIEHDITADYTMGYSKGVGFRAGTCTPFYFYDLTLEMRTSLKVYPFMLMDVSLRLHLGLEVDKALALAKKLVDETALVNGLFMTLWHNHTLSETHGWEGWREMYAELVAYAAAKQQEEKEVEVI